MTWDLGTTFSCFQHVPLKFTCKNVESRRADGTHLVASRNLATLANPKIAGTWILQMDVHSPKYGFSYSRFWPNSIWSRWQWLSTIHTDPYKYIYIYTLYVYIYESFWADVPQHQSLHGSTSIATWRHRVSLIQRLVLSLLRGLEPWNFEWLSIIDGNIESSQLTNSYFSEGLKPPTSIGFIMIIVSITHNCV